MQNLVNIIGFQLGWWMCVLGVKYDLIYSGPLYMFVFILLHLALISFSKIEIKIIIIGSIFGIIIDGLFKSSGMITYLGDTNNVFIPPFWIIAMWSGFSATINHSLSWLNKSIILSFLCGVIFGPLSYIAGQKLGVIFFTSNIYNIFILSIVWGLSIPILFIINNRLQHK